MDMPETVVAEKVSVMDAVKGMLALILVAIAGIVAFGYFSKLLCLLGTRKEMSEFAFFMKAADILTMIVAIVAAIYASLGFLFLISKLAERKLRRKARTLRKEFAVATARRAVLANDMARVAKVLVKGMNFLLKKLGSGIAWIYKM